MTDCYNIVDTCPSSSNKWDNTVCYVVTKNKVRTHAGGGVPQETTSAYETMQALDLITYLMITPFQWCVCVSCVLACSVIYR